MSEHDFNDEDLELNEYLDDHNKTTLRTHTLINKYLNGEIQKLEDGYVELLLRGEQEMVVDELGLIHGGFIFGAADFAAMAAVNEPNVVLVASETQFLSPVKLHDKVLFKAKVRHHEGRKRNVHVEAYVFEIKVFEGEFKTVVTEKHVLKMKLAEEVEERL